MSQEAMGVREVSPGYGLAAATPAVPVGYKQTEIGILPDDWRVAPLSRAVAKLEAGVSVNSVDENLGSYAHDQSVLKTSSITDGRFYPNECKKVSPKDLSRISLSPKADTLLISRMNTPNLVGECGYVRKDYPSLFLPDRLWMTKKNDASETNFRWLSYLLSSKPQKLKIKGLATGTSGSMKNISKDSLLNILLPFPPPKEQVRIATALSDVDALLEELDRLITKKRDIKQATMQQLLTGQSRLPGFEGDWHLGILGDVIANLDAGVSVNSTDESPADGRPCVLKTSAIDSGTLLISESKVIDQGDIARARVNPKKDTLLISRMNTPNLVGEVAYVGQDYDWLFLPDRVWMACFKFELRASVKWLGYVLSSRPYRESLRDIATGTSGSMKNISKPSLLALPISFPEPSEQATIANVISDIDIEIEALKKRRTKIAELKKAIMQELLNGRTRLIGPQNHRGSSC